MIWKRMVYHGEDLGDFYIVSDTGKIKGVKTGTIRKQNVNKEGYYYVCVSLGSRNNKPLIKVHRAVAETFLAQIQGKKFINHKDGNKLNNCVGNLEWCTNKENCQHASDNGLLNIVNKAKIICLETLQVFDSIVDAAKWCSCSHQNISCYLTQKEKRLFAGRHPETNQKLHWMYYNDYVLY